MLELWFFFLQPSFSQLLLASGCEACEVAMISEMLLMRFCRKHWPPCGGSELHGVLVSGLQRDRAVF